MSSRSVRATTRLNADDLRATFQVTTRRFTKALTVTEGQSSTTTLDTLTIVPPRLPTRLVPATPSSRFGSQQTRHGPPTSSTLPATSTALVPLPRSTIVRQQPPSLSRVSRPTTFQSVTPTVFPTTLQRVTPTVLPTVPTTSQPSQNGGTDRPTTTPTSETTLPETTITSFPPPTTTTSASSTQDSSSTPSSSSSASPTTAAETTTVTPTVTTATDPNQGPPAPPVPSATRGRTLGVRSVDGTSSSAAQATPTEKAISGRRTPIYRQPNSPSSLGGSSEPATAKFEQLTEDGDVICEVQDPNSLLSFIAILLVIFGLAVCGHLFWKTLKEWLVFRDQQQQDTLGAPESPLPAPVSLSPSKRRRNGSMCKLDRSSSFTSSDSDVDSDADTVVDDGQLPPEIKAKHDKLRQSMYGASSVRATAALHRRPSGKSTHSNDSSTASIFFNNGVLQVPTLLLLAWALYLADQLLYATVLSLLYWVCPEYNCWARTPLLAPNCPTMPELFTAYVTLQPLASGVFVIATMLMFIRLFAVLSPRRRLALQIGCGVVAAMTLARLVTLILSQYVRRAPETWPPGSPHEVHVWRWYTSVALAGSLLNAVLVKLALIMGLGYIASVRSDVCALRQSVLSLTGPPGASIMVGGAPRKAPGASVRSSSPATYASLLATAEKCEAIERRAVKARRWIVSGIVVITGVVVVHLHQRFAHEGMPVQVCNAIYATIQVAFASCVSMAMASITKLMVSDR